MGRLDAAALGHAEIGALPDHLATKHPAGDADRIVDAVAGLIVGFGRGADVGADPAEPQQVGVELEDCGHHLLRGELLAFESEQCARLIAQRDFLRLPRVDGAARREVILVVVLPTGAREIEQALALGEAALRVRIRIDEDVAMIECRDQLDGALAQHAVPEHVARHVADARNSERGRRDVGVHLAEMAPDRFPCATRRDAHLLVVVANRPAGGERIAEPEAMLDRNAVRDVRERRRTFVGGDHEIGVVVVVADDVLRPDHAIGAKIVGDIEQA